jgi:biopolymer transport protein ExbD
MFKRRQPSSTDMAVNITSLMDALTIILIFLILNFDSQEQSVKPPIGIELPASTSEMPVKLAVKVTLSPERIAVEDQSVMELVAGKAKAGDLDGSQLLKPLLAELQRQKARLQKGTHKEPKPGEDDDSEIVYFEAGKGITYELVDRVLRTAAGAGFTKFRLAVHREG